MKRIIWASILLGLAAIILPALFLRADVQGREALDYEPPMPTQTQAVQVSGAPNENVQAYAGGSDAETVFTVLDNGELRDVSMADYLPLALAAEMPVSFGSEALKAQAVAARTYIIYCTEHENPKHPKADICSDSGCCLAYADEGTLRGAWGSDYEANLEIVRTAVKATDGQILTYGESPILASFHSPSAGKTEAGSELWGDVPYLISVESPETEQDVPDYITTVEVSQGDFKETVLLLRPEAVFSENPAEWLGAAELDESSRVRSIVIGGVALSGSELRSLFALRSTAFTLEYTNEIFLFTVTGYGHGLGMSQYGANVMARNGFNHREILLHYYPQTELR